jgi:hypothetical protein
MTPPADDRPAVVVAAIDPRLIDAVVEFTSEVADVAMSLANLGLSDEAGRLAVALNRLDAAGRD